MATKEKFEEAKRLYETANADQRYVLESLFPELRESEDERIRKEIIAILQYKYERYSKDPKYCNAPQWIAWLEKQGAKVSAIEGFETEFERQVSYLIASAINKEHEYNQGYVKWAANALLNYAKHELEKQGEQKPVDVRTTGYWHVEDVEQKSAWSEEDNRILSTLTKYLEEHGGGIDGWECSFLSKWLKSLRPQSQWMPSNEQIEALDFAADCIVPAEFCFKRKELKELLEQLKKLMEE